MKINYRKNIICGLVALATVVPIHLNAVTIDWSCGWTLRTVDRFGGGDKTKAKTNQGLSLMNRTHSRSKTAVTIRGKRYYTTRFNDTVGSLLDHQNALRNGRVNDQRNQERKFKTDLNTLVSKGGGSNGWGTQPGAYNTINMNRLGLDTMTHELGHNLNGSHDHANRVGGSVNRWTVMYRVGISNRLRNFSSPTVKVRGSNTGRTANPARNNAGRIKARRNIAANRR